MLFPTGGGEEHPLQRWLFGGLGLVAALVLVCVSITMNYQFGLTLGRTPDQGLIYAYASAGADIFKVLSPFFIAAAWRARTWSWITACLLLWLVTTAYGVLSAAGHAALNQADSTGKRVVKAASYQDIDAAIKKGESDLSWIAQHRPADTVKAELQGLKMSTLWTSTSNCSEEAIAGKSARAFCQGLFKLTGELESAKKADDIEETLKGLRKQRAGADGAAITDADPRGNMLARITHLDVAQVNFVLVLLVILLLEAGSGLGPFVSISYAMGGVGKKRKPRAMDLTAVDVTPIIPNPPGAPPLAIAGPVAADLKPEAPKVLKTEVRRPEPNLAARRALQKHGFPDRPFPKGPLRPQDDPREAAEKFMVWLGAHGISGAKTADECWQLYCESCRADHRHPQIERKFKKALVKLGKKGGVQKSIPKGKDGKRPTLWHLRPPKFEDTPKEAKEKAASPVPEPEKTDIKPEEATPPVVERKAFTLIPFARGLPGALIKNPTRWNFGDRFANRVADDQRVVQAEAHSLRREGRNRKQRGSRISRMTRA